MRIVCIGDSLTYGYGVLKKQCWVEMIKQKSGQDVLNKGINGNTSKQMHVRLTKDVLPYKPTHAVIMGGINDLLQGNSAEIVIENIKHITATIVEEEIHPILIFPLPVDEEVKEKSLYQEADFSAVNEEVKKARQALFEFASRNEIQYIDLIESFIDGREEYYLKDGIHITPSAHNLIAEKVFNKLDPL